MSHSLAGKVALITDASRGIGRGIAIEFALQGADVAISYLSHEEDAQEAVNEINGMGRRALAVKADVSNRNAMRKLFTHTLNRFGSMDIVVANAAYQVPASILQADWVHVRRTFEVNLFGVFHTCQLAARQMVAQGQAGRRGGVILLIGSVHAEIPVPDCAPYNMSKAAIEQLGRTLAAELAPYRIRVNTIHPGWIDTPGERTMFGDATVDEGGRRIPWGRLGMPQDIARLAVFLAGGDGDYITGASLRIDGGLTVGQQS